ncbi:Transcriptional regulator [Candidatus Syntrophocurvum alkaliphilum]|uniref:Transcriptional regulator n=1 Tax=Candidatus Syntrophocurvum alkaliphilum TaxID=2293317 RepID=A0A6I6DKG6_9FIRM|nr:helix-turn-helix domain-containing protein [Candidatus Syntrophocurvum alkaliphilum]QGU00497.1 Transcriptional regulator [Candidatus Syntrophocurvum alkaliphilum]
MEFLRIQDKIISWQKIESRLKKALQMRTRGFSQQEVADRLDIDRTFISRLERIGEVRKGQSIACVGFPISNKEEIEQILEKEGVDFILIFTEQERLDYVEQRSGKELLNELMELISKVRAYEIVICIGSDERLKLIENMMDNQVISIEIGSSPITEDKWVDPTEIRKILRSVKAAR